MLLNECPVCGEEMQMTKVGEVYYTLVRGGWQRTDSSDDTIRVYCVNDHPVTDSDIVAAMAALPVIAPVFGNR